MFNANAVEIQHQYSMYVVLLCNLTCTALALDVYATLHKNHRRLLYTWTGNMVSSRNILVWSFVSGVRLTIELHRGPI